MSAHVDNLPSLEEFASLLFARPDGEAAKIKRQALLSYAYLWAPWAGVPMREAVDTARGMADEAQATADERHAEASR